MTQYLHFKISSRSIRNKDRFYFITLLLFLTFIISFNILDPQIYNLTPLLTPKMQNFPFEGDLITYPSLVHHAPCAATDEWGEHQLPTPCFTPKFLLCLKVEQVCCYIKPDIPLCDAPMHTIVHCIFSFLPHQSLQLRC